MSRPGRFGLSLSHDVRTSDVGLNTTIAARFNCHEHRINQNVDNHPVLSTDTLRRRELSWFKTTGTFTVSAAESSSAYVIRT